MEYPTDQAAPNSLHAQSRRRMAVMLTVSALVAWILVASLFAVDVTEHALVTRFGAVVRSVGEPGLHLKLPFDSVVRLDRRLTFSRPGQAEYLTVDKKNIVVESLVTWRVSDPERYYVTLATRSASDVVLADVMLGELGAVLGTYPSASLIAADGDSQRFRKIVGEIRDRVAGFARAAYGIEVIDVALLQLSLPEQNRASVFERMKAERGKMAKEYRTAGELQGKKIIAQADREKIQIEAQAYSQAQHIRAEGDAEATRIYSAAFSRNPAFYRFLRTLQAYEKFMDENTTLFLPADAEVLRVLGPLPHRGAVSPAQRFETADKPQSTQTMTVLRPEQPQSESAQPENQSAEPQRGPR
ncbi:MAG: protease modulator HflC [Burkholderiales bacterium]